MAYDEKKIVLYGILALAIVATLQIVARPELTGFVTTTQTCNPACAAQEVCQNGRCVYKPSSTCINTAPSGIVLHPNSGTIAKGTDTKVSWSLQSWGVNCNGNKNYYSVQIADASPYSDFRTVANQLTSYQNYYTLSGSPGKTYYWRVIAKNGAYQLVSGYSSFTVTPTTRSCSNGIKDDQETDVDCGAICLYNQCPLGRKCNTISDCKGGLVCTNGVCANPTSSCTDTDRGNNILVKGTLFFYNSTQKNTETDSCDIRGQLIEYYCTSANSYKWTISSCPIGLTCRDGACVKSPTPVCGNKICESGEKDQLKGCQPPVVGQACDPVLIKGTCPIDCQSPTPVCGNKICESGENTVCTTCPRGAPECAAPGCIPGTCPQDCPAPAPAPAPAPSPNPSPAQIATGRAVLNPQVRQSLTVTFVGNPEPRANSGIIGGIRQSILGEPSVVTRYASLNELNKELNVNEYILREVNLDDNLYTYSVVLGPGIDVREAAQKFGSDFYVSNI
ncbi:MAG: hypothetical protein EPN86_03410 [Nanoarchaeota archaeon]|nr:MAG: hypothetical protein EPN86_03410 [Nanoarchaeota archaeon]